jgi:gliding motility-associated-like protein
MRADSNAIAWANTFYPFIYNRWGEQVFVTNDLNTSWNGEYKGTKLPGAYVYYVTYIDCMGETKLIKGTITIIR